MIWSTSREGKWKYMEVNNKKNRRKLERFEVQVHPNRKIIFEKGIHRYMYLGAKDEGGMWSIKETWEEKSICCGVKQYSTI